MSAASCTEVLQLSCKKKSATSQKPNTCVHYVKIFLLPKKYLLICSTELISNFKQNGSPKESKSKFIMTS